MALMRGNWKLNTNIKYHLLIGGAAGLWITLFLVIVGPFDSAPLPMSWRARVMIGYGLVFFICYTLVIPVQNWWFARREKWTLQDECSLYFLMFGICLPASFAYYGSGFINGDFGFGKFGLEVFLPTLLILLPLLIIARWLVNKMPTLPDSAQETKKPEEIDMIYWKPRIDALMAQEVYLNPDLSLKSMAEQLGTNSSVLSRVVNQGYGANFNDFINRYRVEAVRRELEKGAYKTHTLPGIALNCGFSSKATFNRAFKKHMQVAPSSYIAQLEQHQ